MRVIFETLDRLRCEDEIPDWLAKLDVIKRPYEDENVYKIRTYERISFGVYREIET